MKATATKTFACNGVEAAKGHVLTDEEFEKVKANLEELKQAEAIFIEEDDDPAPVYTDQSPGRMPAQAEKSMNDIIKDMGPDNPPEEYPREPAADDAEAKGNKKKK